MAGRLLLVPFGAAATDLLGRLVAEARGDDPLRPVTVVVPSSVAGTTLRRRLATSAGGLANVAFQSLPQLAEAIAAPELARGEPPLSPVRARAEVRAALAAEPGALAPVAGSAATERALEATVRELADLGDGHLSVLEGRGRTVAATVGVARRFVAATGGRGTPGEAVRVAARVARERGGSPMPAPVIVHLPRRLSATEVDLLAALAERTDVSVVIGRTSHTEADEPGTELAARVAAAFGVPVPPALGPSDPPAPTRLVRVPDPAEEVAVAVRTVVGALRGDDATVPVRPERIAVVSRVDDPYLTAAHEQLVAAGVPHSVRATTTLAQSVTGRSLVGALALPELELRRRDVMAWLRGGPLRDPVADGPAPAAWWDRLARRAGIVGGLDQWRQRLARAIEQREERVVERAQAEAQDVDAELAGDGRLRGFRALGAFVDDLAVRLTPPGDPTWAVWSRWAGGIVTTYLAPPPVDVDVDGGRWPRGEREAAAAIADALDGMAQLDGVEPPPESARFRRVLERELDQRTRPYGVFGRGVVVGRIADIVGADLDLVIVLGAADGTLPPRRRDDPLVPDRVRAVLGGALAPRGLDRAEEHRDLLAALAAAPRTILIGPRSDPREQRERQPAPWYLEAASARAGHPVDSAEVAALAAHPWFTEVESLEWWLGEGRPAATPSEHDLVELLARHRAGAPLVGAAAVGADAVLARGMEAAVARRAAAFDEWSGNVGDAGDLLPAPDQPRSPTGLEQYANCPFRFFLGNVLGVGRLDDPTDADVISALDHGSLVHEILERFVRTSGVRPPGEPWSADDRARLLELAEEVAGRYESEGRTGRRVLWSVRTAQLRHQLLRILDQDEELRARHGVGPAAVEVAFGWGDDPPVEIELDGGRRIAFKGQVDRIDRSPDGSKAVVYDYKTGRSYYYRTVDYAGDDASGAAGDLTARGTKLQLPIYSLAARARFPEVGSIAAYYWFVDERGRASTRGGPYDDAADARFREVVTTVVDGIEAGSFPANPGEETWRSGRWSHDNCLWCDFDRVCPTTRGEQWVQIRQHPRVAGYVRLAEQQPAPSDEAES